MLIKLWRVKSLAKPEDLKVRIGTNAEIFWSDDRNCHWTFDTKLSNGQWLDVRKINNELDEFLVMIV